MSQVLKKQLGWFLGIGLANTAVDLMVLNIGLMIAGGLWWSYPVCKAIASLIATTQSFFLNTRFTFSGTRGHPFVFLLVTVFGMIVNVTIASVLFFVATKWGMNEPLASNGAAIIATGGNMVTNFLGYKYVVFRKKIF